MSQSMDKSMRLIDFVAEGHDTLPALAAATGYPKSTVHRLLSVLEEHGWVRREGNRYTLGFRILELANDLKTSLKLPDLARPLMRQVAARTQEAVHLAQLDGAKIVYIEKVSGLRGIEMASRVGMTVPVHCTALGKLLLSYLPPDSWEPVIAESARNASPELVSTVAGQLPTVMSLAASLDLEENERGIRCLAVPVFDADGAVPAALSISGAAFHVTWDRLPGILDQLRECSSEVSRQLGGDRFARNAFREPSEETIRRLRDLYPAPLTASPA